MRRADSLPSPAGSIVGAGPRFIGRNPGFASVVLRHPFRIAAVLSSDPSRWRRLALAAVALSVGLAACGDDEDGGGGGRIKPNPDNAGVEVTIGSRAGTEREILAEIYSQALEAAGYKVVTDSDFGSEQEARQALSSGEISGYPEYLAELLSASGAAPSDKDEATAAAHADLRRDGLIGFEPAPYSRTSAVGLLVSTAEKLKVEKVSDLRGKAEELRFSGTSACESSPICLAGIEDAYGLSVGEFVPADPVARYGVLDDGAADLSIIETTDAPLFATPLHYTTLDDDQGVFPAGNPMFVSSPRAVKDAGPDLRATIERVQRGLDLNQIQELNALVDVTGEQPAPVARDYLLEFGYIPENSAAPRGDDLLQRR
jgi:glycine betaine/choline ABC-type transport system substrate-binding protein